MGNFKELEGFQIVGQQDGWYYPTSSTGCNSSGASICRDETFPGWEEFCRRARLEQSFPTWEDFVDKHPVVPLVQVFAVFGQNAVPGRRAIVRYLQERGNVSPSTAREWIKDLVPRQAPDPIKLYSFTNSLDTFIEQKKAASRTAWITNLSR